VSVELKRLQIVLGACFGWFAKPQPLIRIDWPSRPNRAVCDLDRASSGGLAAIAELAFMVLRPWSSQARIFPAQTFGDKEPSGMAAGTTQTIRSNGVDLCVETFGAQTAPPLVLIMGLGAQMIAWPDPFCEAIAAKGFHVIRFDNRDIGQSSRLEHLGVPNTMALMGELALGRKLTVPYTLRDMAADTIGLLEHFGIERAHIVGASMGGMIGQELAIHSASRLRSLTSIMSSTGDPRLPTASPEATAILFAPVPTDHAGYVKHYANVLRILRGPHFPEDAADDPARIERIFARGVNPAGVMRQFAAILASGNRTTALKSVQTPTLVIHGDADPLVRIEGGRATAAAIPMAQLEIIPKMGHSLPTALCSRLVDLITAHATQH
jgi:pimeloyl-ACP methyl ester carboxylesterase